MISVYIYYLVPQDGIDLNIDVTMDVRLVNDLHLDPKEDFEDEVSDSNPLYKSILFYTIQIRLSRVGIIVLSISGVNYVYPDTDSSSVNDNDVFPNP